MCNAVESRFGPCEVRCRDDVVDSVVECKRRTMCIGRSLEKRKCAKATNGEEHATMRANCECGSNESVSSSPNAVSLASYSTGN